MLKNGGKNQFLNVLALVTVITGCGKPPVQGQPIAVTAPVAPSASQNQNAAQPTPSSTAANGDENFYFALQSSSTSNSCTNNSSPAPASTTVGSYQTPGITTDNIFKVTISSGSYVNLPCTGYTTRYSCLGYTVTVGSRSKQVLVSFGNPKTGPCAGIPSSQTLDFSDQAGPGHGPLSVTVNQPQSDNCHIEGDSTSSGCPMAPIYPNYVVQGSLVVKTNSPN